MNRYAPIRKLILCGIWAPLLLVGCQRPTEDVEVTGTVKWNGTPLPDGMIVLQPLSPNQAPSGGRIVNGEFRLRAKPGKMRVQIEAVRATNQRDPHTGTQLGEMYIPTRYNQTTELEADITREGKNSFEFALTK